MRSFNLRQSSSARGRSIATRSSSSWSRSSSAASAISPCPTRCRQSSRSPRRPPAPSSSSRSPPRLHGPCYRCLGDAVLELPIDGARVPGEQPEGAEELRTPYLEDDNLDLAAWSRDAVALALPEQDPLPRRLRGPVPDVRQEPQRGAARARGEEPRTPAGRRSRRCASSSNPASAADRRHVGVAVARRSARRKASSSSRRSSSLSSSSEAAAFCSRYVAALRAGDRVRRRRRATSTHASAS